MYCMLSCIVAYEILRDYLLHFISEGGGKHPAI